MSLAMTGSEITIHEKMLVPGDFVPYEVLFETDVWQGGPVKKQAPPIPLEIQTQSFETKTSRTSIGRVNWF